ncbi:hypothetical protein NDU88_007519 [Pleurodeles waltl]|uniref:Uncharacterized protein n=1 Tax=Pleurodeles waltl TaxID=8319 RepID=A0AAV7ST04_PLEWA|nr:hypothetical protein NDU88_007519 [Pleurodeles waltl]
MAYPLHWDKCGVVRCLCKRTPPSRLKFLKGRRGGASQKKLLCCYVSQDAEELQCEAEMCRCCFLQGSIKKHVVNHGASVAFIDRDAQNGRRSC